jgi:hypothetical protein
MLTHADDRPTHPAQSARHSRVSPHVACDLREPERAVAPYPTATTGAAMPETSVDENRDALVAEDKVWPAGQLRTPAPPSHPEAAHEADQPHLGREVTLRAYRRHHERALRLGKNIRHNHIQFRPDPWSSIGALSSSLRRVPEIVGGPIAADALPKSRVRCIARS